MKFLKIYAENDTQIFLNMKDVKKILKQEGNYFVELFSGEVFHLENCMPPEYQRQHCNEIENFLESKEIIFDQYLQLQCDDHERCSVIRGYCVKI